MFKKAICSFLFLTILLQFFACQEEFYFESEKTIAEDQWTYQDSVNFTFSIADTSALYNLILDIEHATDYRFQNIYLNVATKYPSGKRIKEQLPINFADKMGKWYGDCDSEWCRLRVNLQQGAFFNAVGDYTITLEQHMRVNPLPGVRGLSLKLEDTGRRRTE
ncbi:MAG: gliding motility lipoprotein GldH [Saprospiraceae bacterium]